MSFELVTVTSVSMGKMPETFDLGLVNILLLCVLQALSIIYCQST